ncbi:MAG: hypothetical protein ACF8PN_04765 [Phycisphaerales bacterium]
MNIVVRSVLGLIALAVAAFAVFGLMATFEPAPLEREWLWRIVYIVLIIIGLGALAVIYRAGAPE